MPPAACSALAQPYPGGHRIVSSHSVPSNMPTARPNWPDQNGIFAEPSSSVPCDRPCKPWLGKRGGPYPLAGPQGWPARFRRRRWRCAQKRHGLKPPAKCHHLCDATASRSPCRALHRGPECVTMSPPCPALVRRFVGWNVVPADLPSCFAISRLAFSCP